MNIRLLRTCSVPIRIGSPELHVSDTCFLHELHIVERYLTTTYRLHELLRILNIHSIEYDALCV